jgi:hypothetical protein
MGDMGYRMVMLRGGFVLAEGTENWSRGGTEQGFADGVAAMAGKVVEMRKAGATVKGGKWEL